jgi:hypothetical protein
MQWKLKIIEFFKRDNTLFNEPNDQRIDIKTSEVLMKQLANERQLPEEQLAVINRFPQPFDSSNEKFIKFDKLIDEWKPKSEIWPFVYNIKLLSFINGLTAFYIGFRFRKFFKIADGRTALLNVYIPSLSLPLFFGSLIHHLFITSPIIEGKEICSVCQCLNAGLVQSLTSTVYPMIFSSITSIYYAHYFNKYPIPDNINDKTSRKYIYNLLFKSIRRNRIGLTAIGIANFLFAFYLTNREQQTIHFMYLTLLQKEFNKSKNIV